MDPRFSLYIKTALKAFFIYISRFRLALSLIGIRGFSLTRFLSLTMGLVET